MSLCRDMMPSWEIKAEMDRLTIENERLGRDYQTARDAHDKLLLENERLRSILELYRDAVRIDVTMEGPKFMGANSSALKRAWDADLATLGDHNEKGN